MPMSTQFQDFELGTNLEKKMKNDNNSGYSYLNLLMQLAKVRLIIDSITLTTFDNNKFSKLTTYLHSFEEQYNKLYPETNSTELRFLLDETYLGYLVFEARFATFEKKYDKSLQLYLKGLSQAQELRQGPPSLRPRRRR